MDASYSSSSSSPSTSPHSSSSEARESGGFSCMVSHIFGRVVCAIITCIFAIVGSLVGTITGALIGLATESGLLRGAGIGAISGAVFSIEVVESSLDLWNSRESGIWSILYVLDIISSLLSGRLVREKVGPAVQSAVQSQMSALSLQFMETPDFFETGGIRGLSIEAVEKIPKVEIAAEESSDAAGEKICCSVCLQDFQIGETVRRLPLCQHMFHLPCIDSWLIRHGSCPLCRGDI
ncbi:NEP1-interacting protein 2 [Canna indica]|uniref:NEP1-interacting protein 2 n=1 Tax=Canna indica TaxID=4628 RepID=A0AAQ3KEL6_9LILI|nr:NEP1-interacting protein 2 [Canna indica]